MINPAEAARFLAGYAKQFHAGAFATPTAQELARQPVLEEWRSGSERTLAVIRRLTRPTTRHDFTGAAFALAPGVIVTHLARTAGAPVPDFGSFAYVMAYAEDHELCAGLASQGRAPVAVRISAASEIIACYGWPGQRKPYAPADTLTMSEVATDMPARPERDRARRRAGAEAAFSDDFPFYSDGSWGAVILRGFKPDDDHYGIKPAEMPRAWQEAHPEASRYRPGWTPAAERHPELVEWVRAVPWWRKLERVRLLRMAGRDGKGGRLSRHCDITDRAAGTRDGQIARFHIPVITDPAVVMHWWELDGAERIAHLAAWRCYYLDARKPHAVTNAAGIDRIHLVVDVVVDEAVRAHLEEAA